jgi:plastocyanin
MLRVLGLLFTTALLLCNLSCTSPDNRQAIAPAVATSTPTPATAPSPTGPTTASVIGTNFEWTDQTSGSTKVTTIKVGGTVTWTAVGNHKLAREAKTLDNGCEELDPSFDTSVKITEPVPRTFTKVGTFGYHCGVHGGTANCKNPEESDGMSAVIKVVP